MRRLVPVHFPNTMRGIECDAPGQRVGKGREAEPRQHGMKHDVVAGFLRLEILSSRGLGDGRPAAGDELIEVVRRLEAHEAERPVGPGNRGTDCDTIVAPDPARAQAQSECFDVVHRPKHVEERREEKRGRARPSARVPGARDVDLDRDAEVRLLVSAEKLIVLTALPGSEIDPRSHKKPR